VFTGIVEEVGLVRAVEPHRLWIGGRIAVRDARLGDSIAVAGACLTVVDLDGESFWVDVMPETLRRTTLGSRAVGDAVNLERAVRADGRLGGHIVQGHVDGVAQLVDRRPGGDFDTVRVALDPALGRYAVPKGSIALDGVSLTVVAVDDAAAGPAVVTVGLIPATLRGTTLGRLSPGDQINVEVDILAKYVERLVAGTRGGAS
jgi:riboflavin synthase